MIKSSFQELKSSGHHLAVFKPSPVHWARFADEVARQRVFDQYIELGATQALWQFTNTLGVVVTSKSTREAKENAVLTLHYINVTRMVLAQMLSPSKSKLLSADFLEKLAAVQTDLEMANFVKNEFAPLVKLPINSGTELMNWDRTYEPMEQILKYLLKNVSLEIKGIWPRGTAYAFDVKRSRVRFSERTTICIEELPLIFDLLFINNKKSKACAGLSAPNLFYIKASYFLNCYCCSKSKNLFNMFFNNSLFRNSNSNTRRYVISKEKLQALFNLLKLTLAFTNSLCPSYLLSR